jgi:predicted Rossmann fold flavoprotein
MQNPVIIVGGGASGMIAAIAARRKGAEVIILEANPRVGKKILATGNGRCNISNINTDVSRYHGRHPEFVLGPLSRFDVDSAMAFFETLGIYHRVEDDGKVYPMSNQASSVLDVLRYELESSGINVICDARVKKIEKKKTFEVTVSDGRTFNASSVILAAGGKASPSLGSDGSGYALARKLGHSIIEPFPALVQLKLSAVFLKQVQGIKFDGEAEIIADNKTVRSERGEILFTEYGISGPPILQLSRKAGEYLSDGKRVILKVILVSYLTEDELDSLLVRRFSDGAEKPLTFNFVGFINKKLIPIILREAKIEDINKPAGAVTAEERKRIVSVLTDWRFEITGTNSWSNAQVTAGGVDVAEIDGRTMESRIVPGLYFAGEIVDIDGDCGGFNLQWAWSSGFIAGEHAAETHNQK